jgi:epimerase transport system membrane fusion protein
MRARNAIKNEEALFMARLSDREGEEAVLNSQRKGWSEILQSKKIIAESLTEEIADLNELLADGFVDKQRVRELERMRSQVMGEIADLRVSIDEVALKIAQMRKRFKTEVVDELTQTDEELHDLEQQFTASEDTVLRATIRAPVSGIVLNLKPNTVGAVIQSGETLMEIVPQTSKLIVDARISPMDIDRVSVGQDAEVRFSVFKDAYMVSGFLKKLSADRLVDEGSDTPYYSAEIDLHEEDLNLLEGMTLVPGMPAEVLIKTGERTLLAYVVSPMNRIFSRALIEE